MSFDIAGCLVEFTRLQRARDMSFFQPNKNKTLTRFKSENADRVITHSSEPMNKYERYSS